MKQQQKLGCPSSPLRKHIEVREPEPLLLPDPQLTRSTTCGSAEVINRVTEHWEGRRLPALKLKHVKAWLNTDHPKLHAACISDLREILSLSDTCGRKLPAHTSFCLNPASSTALARITFPHLDPFTAKDLKLPCPKTAHIAFPEP